MKFLRDYARYLRELNLRQFVADWARHFGDEVLKSPLNQVSLVFGVMGITGIIIGLFHFILAHPLVPLVAMLCGMLVLLLLSMLSFHLSRRAAAALAEASPKDLETLLEQLMHKGKMTRIAIRDFLGISDHRTSELLGKATAEGWLEQRTGTWKVAEAMKPILRRQLRDREEEKPQ